MLMLVIIIILSVTVAGAAGSSASGRRLRSSFLVRNSPHILQLFPAVLCDQLSEKYGFTH